jgi:tetratricopeptide (TPR) repeat protein
LAKVSRAILSLWLIASPAAAIYAQTFELTPQQQTAADKASKKKKKKSAATPAPDASQPPAEPAEAPAGGIGWGSGIEVARDARAAQQALGKGDYNAAADSASRAAHSAPQNAGLWFLFGYSARLAGHYDDALYAYKKGLNRLPSSIQGLSGLAQTYAKMGRTGDAQNVLKQVLAANPKSVNDLELAGELALSSSPSTALSLLERAEQLQSSARNELLIARAYQRLKQNQAAEQYLDKALQRDPNDPNILRALGAFYRDSGAYDRAIPPLQKAAAKAANALPELAYTYQLAGKKNEAAETYAQAADRSPRDEGLQLSAAQAEVNVGQFERAEGFLKHAAASDPNHYRLHAIRGQIASLEDRNEEAVREYREALDHLPAVVPEGPLYAVSVHLSLYELYQRTEQAEAAEREVRAARAGLDQITVQEETSRPEFLRLRALTEAALGDAVSAEKDLKAALALDPTSVNIILNYANLLWKTDRSEQAYAMYKKGLELDPGGHAALTALGYLSREISDAATAEGYFKKLESLYPKDFVPFLALGDLYTSEKRFDDAEASYRQAHALAPSNPLVVAGGVNSALEAQRLPAAKSWLEVADAVPGLNENPQLMRERERYLTRTGQYEAAAALGYKVLEKLPRDPEAPVYLAYDLLYLNRYDEAFTIVRKYQAILPKDKDLHLVAGYVLAHEGRPRAAEEEFTLALALDPNVATTYMNRGYVRNDLREAAKAVGDFEAAIKLRPDYAEAHLGLAYSYLQLHRAKAALKEADIATKLGGESGATHMAKAEAYRQQVMFRQAEVEYRAALKFSPNDVNIHLAVADALYRLHRYDEAIAALKGALGLGTDDSLVYASMARAYAQLRERDNALAAVGKAEQKGESSKVLMATGEAMLVLGEHKAAMERYARALNAPDSDRVEVRLALARLFANSGHHDAAQEQVSFAIAEARIGEANAVTAENLLEAADVLMSIEQFELAKKFYERAQTEGADDASVSLGLANAYLAEGRTGSAELQLKSLGNSPENLENFDYLVALGNVYRQEQRMPESLAMFARANGVGEGNEFTHQTELDLAGDEGRNVTETLSLEPELSLAPIFEDINIYQMDARLRGVQFLPQYLPPPRSSVETRLDSRYKLHFKGWPVISGLVEERNARGSLSFPDELLIEHRNTYDTIFNGGVNPVIRWGDNTVTFNPGLQYTVRRDLDSPLNLNQNLFRQYLYMYTSPFLNWVTVSGTAIREAGPFTEQDLHSRDASASLQFIVGRPWAKTALLTGYDVRDLLFRPLIAEYYSTGTYIGVQRKFGLNWRAAVLGEYLRSWRVQDSLYAVGQAMRPAFTVDYRPLASHWSAHAEGMWSRGEGFHDYDNVSNEFTVSYTKVVERPVRDEFGSVPVNYPLRFSLGIQQQTFYDFPGSGTHTFLPVVRLNIF